MYEYVNIGRNVCKWEERIKCLVVDHTSANYMIFLRFNNAEVKYYVFACVLWVFRRALFCFFFEKSPGNNIKNGVRGINFTKFETKDGG